MNSKDPDQSTKQYNLITAIHYVNTLIKSVYFFGSTALDKVSFCNQTICIFFSFRLKNICGRHALEAPLQGASMPTYNICLEI